MKDLPFPVIPVPGESPAQDLQGCGPAVLTRVQPAHSQVVQQVVAGIHQVFHQAIDDSRLPPVPV